MEIAVRDQEIQKTRICELEIAVRDQEIHKTRICELEIAVRDKEIQKTRICELEIALKADDKLKSNLNEELCDQEQELRKLLTAKELEAISKDQLLQAIFDQKSEL